MPSRPSVITRRELVVAGTVLASAAFVPTAWGRILSKDPAVGPGSFLDGVASGEPAPDAITLWSRLTTERARSGARLVVATDEGLARTVATTVVPTGRAIDGSLKARVGGLAPDTVYYYAWQSGDGISPVGRTKTAPAADSDQPLNLAYSSCQNYPVGFFNGHREAAGLDPLDLYLFLGDYTYETDNTGDENARDSPGATTDLASYRAKLKLYRSDPALRELHRLQPCSHIWDDHEVSNNYNEDTDERASRAQRAFGYRASFEWLPRMAFPDERFRIYKPFVLGRQAEVIMLDQRQYREGDGDGRQRRLLGRTQMDFLKARLSASQARWKIIGNQVMVAPLEVGAAGAGDPINPDQWDGYPEDQQELIDHIAGASGGPKIDNVVFVTGDIHTYMANNVHQDPDDIMSPKIATEFIGGSITSSGLPVPEPAVMASNPWIRRFNGDDKGYAKLDLTRENAIVDFRIAPIDVPDAPSESLDVWTQPAGTNDFSRTGGGRRRGGRDAPDPDRREDSELTSRNAPNRRLARRRRRFERFLREQEAGR